MVQFILFLYDDTMQFLSMIFLFQLDTQHVAPKDTEKFSTSPAKKEDGNIKYRFYQRRIDALRKERFMKEEHALKMSIMKADQELRTNMSNEEHQLKVQGLFYDNEIKKLEMFERRRRLGLDDL